MALNKRQVTYLSLLGIPVWQPRKENIGLRSEITSSSIEADLPAESVRMSASPEWSTLEQTVSGCTNCVLHQTRIQTVFGRGNRRAAWMFVGEAPGAEEDRQGQPFVGSAGQLLSEMLYALHLDRDEVYIANILKCRPPNNRNPLPEEVQQCEPYLQRQLDMIRPKIIVALGRVAAQNLLKTDERIGSMRGRRYHYGTLEIPVVVTYHPAYLLRNPVEKRKTWQDLCLAKKIITEQGGRVEQAT